MNSSLDLTDRQILNILQQDCRLEIRKIASLVHKSASPVHERIRKLKEQGVIKRYVAILDHEKIGKPLLAITQVTLTDQTQATFLRFEAHINQQPEVQLGLSMSGICDFILHIAVPDTRTYQDFLMNRISSLPYVVSVHTSFVLKEIKSYTPYVLSEK